MRILHVVMLVYAAACAAVAFVPATPETPALPKFGGYRAKGTPHEQSVLETAHLRMQQRASIRLAGFLGRDGRSLHAYGRVRKAHDRVAGLWIRYRDTGRRPTDAEIREGYRALDDAATFLKSALDHQRKWIVAVRVQLGLACTLAVIAALLGWFGAPLGAAIGYLLGAVAPLLYGILVQPFPGEPLALSGPLAIPAILSFVHFLRARRSPASPA